MMRLFKEVTKTMDHHMLDLKEHKQEAKPSVLIEQAEELPVDDEAKRKLKLKYQPIYVSEYKEQAGHFHKLIDTL